MFSDLVYTGISSNNLHVGIHNLVSFNQVNIPEICGVFPAKTFKSELYTTSRIVNTEEIPQRCMKYPMIEIFNYHNRFYQELNKLIIPGEDCYLYDSDLCNSISDIISSYDQSLIHLPEDILNLFFDFTDLLEGLMLVSKRRQICIQNVEDIVGKLTNIYGKIYSLLISPNIDNISSINEELSEIDAEMTRRGLIPTEEEFDVEIAEEIDEMSDKEKEELARIRALY